MPRPTEVAAVLAEAAKTINHPATLEDTLDAIVHAARDTIPGLEHVGISILHRNGRVIQVHDRVTCHRVTGPGLTPEAIQLAELFAAHASIALGRKRYEHQLTEAVASRQVIGTAVGILMERYQITEERAFQFLVRTSRTSNHKVRLIAQEVVDSSNDRFARPES